MMSSADPISQFFGSKLLQMLGSNRKSLKPLTDLLAFLGPNLWPKNSQIFQECRRGLVGISLINLWHFDHTFGTRNAGKSIKPSKDSYYSQVSKKNSSQKMDLGVSV